MEAILNEIQLGVDGLSDPDQVLEIPTNGDPYCPITGEQRDGALNTTNITGSALIIHRGTLLPGILKEKVLSSLGHDEWDKFSAQLNYYLRLQGFENITKEEISSGKN